MINLSRLSPIAEVWTGLVHDTGSRAIEQFGGSAVALVFADHRGSRLLRDLSAFSAMCVVNVRAGSRIVADNVLKPGAPLFLFGTQASACLWSLAEFGSTDLEDWMSASGVA
eukprot:gnl/MRDRNA2_/MRDRNA2_41837_c0_seq1.p2 gnl/MRDRNA2_/MRDRNA2_41837_c0~~gnl/MRDRNA2_/MRDRNA2_41837_c0_seq1.p2  ORF type:complete len:112 (-),score=13.43 gnl/MRDRNA2_/MRDRNA2_41837_c0_seq1:32-367(-)